MTVSVYVPKNGPLSAVVEPRSAIVGTPASDWFDAHGVTTDEDSWRIVIDYEGRKYNQANMERFADKAFHAFDRHRTHYPTAARACVKADDLVEVGSFDGTRIIPNNDGAAALLRAWIGSDDPKELEVTR